MKKKKSWTNEAKRSTWSGRSVLTEKERAQAFLFEGAAQFIVLQRCRIDHGVSLPFKTAASLVDSLQKVRPESTFEILEDDTNFYIMEEVWVSPYALGRVKLFWSHGAAEEEVSRLERKKSSAGKYFISREITFEKLLGCKIAFV